MGVKITRLLGAAILAIGATSGAKAQARRLTSWGGTTQDAQKEPGPTDSAENGVNVLQDGPTTTASSRPWSKGQVPGTSSTWRATMPSRPARPDSGTDRFSVDRQVEARSAFRDRHAVGSFYYSFVIGCNKDAVEECPRPGPICSTQPSSPASAPSTSGRRRACSRPPFLPMAWLRTSSIRSTSTAPSRSSTRSRPISSGGPAAQVAAASRFRRSPFGRFWNGRLYRLPKTGVPSRLPGTRTYRRRILVVPKGSKNKEAAMKFIAHATSAQGQAEFAAATGYAPINLESGAAETGPGAALPDAQAETQINPDMNYWAEHRDEIGKRWYAWQAQ